MTILRFHPGDTLVLNFILPFSPYDVQAVALSFRNENSVVFETLATSCVPEPEGTNIDEATKCRVGYTLTQAESLQFAEFEYYRAQLNVYGPNGSRIASDEIKVETGAQQLIDPSYASVNIATAGTSGRTIDSTTALSYNDLIDKPRINSRVLTGNRILPEQRIPNEIIDQIFEEESGETEEPITPEEPAVDPGDEPTEDSETGGESNGNDT